MDAAGNVYVAGGGSANAFKIRPDGVITQIIDATGDRAGNGLLGCFGIAVDTMGIVYATGAGSDNAFKIAPDCNANGIPDACDIDCNLPGGTCNVPCCGTSLDCNTNGIPDECELAENECNGNGIPDDCDIASGTSQDCNNNGIPDECEPDTDGDGVINECDNCPRMFNPDQSDSDSDGFGDACNLRVMPHPAGPLPGPFQRRR